MKNLTQLALGAAVCFGACSMDLTEKRDVELDKAKIGEALHQSVIRSTSKKLNTICDQEFANLVSDAQITYVDQRGDMQHLKTEQICEIAEINGMITHFAIQLKERSGVAWHLNERRLSVFGNNYIGRSFGVASEIPLMTSQYLQISDQDGDTVYRVAQDLQRYDAPDGFSLYVPTNVTHEQVAQVAAYISESRAYISKKTSVDLGHVSFSLTHSTDVNALTRREEGATKILISIPFFFSLDEEEKALLLRHELIHANYGEYFHTEPFVELFHHIGSDRLQSIAREQRLFDLSSVFSTRVPLQKYPAVNAEECFVSLFHLYISRAKRLDELTSFGLSTTEIAALEQAFSKLN